MANDNSSGKRMNTSFLLNIVVGLLFISLGIQGLIGRGDPDTIGNVYRLFDSESLVTVVAIVILISGFLQLIPLVFRGVSSAFVKIGRIVILVVWIAVIVLADIFPGFSGFDGVDWVMWIQQLMYHLIVLAAVLLLRD